MIVLWQYVMIVLYSRQIQTLSKCRTKNCENIWWWCKKKGVPASWKATFAIALEEGTYFVDSFCWKTFSAKVNKVICTQAKKRYWILGDTLKQQLVVVVPNIRGPFRRWDVWAWLHAPKRRARNCINLVSLSFWKKMGMKRPTRIRLWC